MSRRTWWQVAFAASCVVNLVAVYGPEGGPQLFPYADKLVHLFVFGLVGFTGVRARLPVSWLGTVLVLNAVGSELVQHFWLPDRTGDVFDAVADVAGVLLGAWLAGRLAGGTHQRHRGPR